MFKKIILEPWKMNLEDVLEECRKQKGTVTVVARRSGFSAIWMPGGTKFAHHEFKKAKDIAPWIRENVLKK